MARVSKRQRRRQLLQRKNSSVYERYLVTFFKSSTPVKSMLLQQILKLGKVAQKYLKRPRDVFRKCITDWCDRDMTEMGDAEFTANFRLSRSAFRKLCQEMNTCIKKKNIFARNTISVHGDNNTYEVEFFRTRCINYRVSQHCSFNCVV